MDTQEFLEICKKHRANEPGINYGTAKLIRINPLTKLKMVSLRGLFNVRSDREVIETLLSVYEELSGKSLVDDLTVANLEE